MSYLWHDHRLQQYRQGKLGQWSSSPDAWGGILRGCRHGRHRRIVDSRTGSGTWWVDLDGLDSRAACLSRVSTALEQAREEAEGRLLAARLTLVGRTSASDELYRDRDDFLLSCRDWANSRGDVWIEKLSQRTQAPSSANGADIVEVLDLNSPTLRAEVLASLEKDLENLRTKMPAGLSLAAGLPDLADPEVLDRLLDAAEDEVVRRLLDADGKDAS